MDGIPPDTPRCLGYQIPEAAPQREGNWSRGGRGRWDTLQMLRIIGSLVDVCVNTASFSSLYECYIFS